MNVLCPTIGGKLREETSGVDRSQAVSASWGIDPVKEIGQTCGLNVIMRRLATSNRSVVTAAKLVYSTWKFNQALLKQPGESDGKAISESIGTATASLVASVWRTSGRI